MTDYLKRSWAAIDLDAIAHNVRTIRGLLPENCAIMAVVKADAYGHGDRYITHALAELGVDWFGVSNIDEAMSLRSEGILHPILILGATPEQYVRTLAEHNFTQTVYSPEYAERLHATALDAGVGIDVHIKVDTGMSRLGFVATGGGIERAVEQIRAVHAMKRLRPGGIFTHFACADETDADSVAYTRAQHNLFLEVTKRLEEVGITYPLRHCCNSAGMLHYPEMHMDMVRPGLMLYGLTPGGVKPAMSLFSSVTMVKELPPDTSVSYGRAYTTGRQTTIATVAIGYADGYGRELSGKARMLVHGQYANVIGRVTMDQLMLDVTHIPGVREGDVVTIVGIDGENILTFDEMAQLSGTIVYEKICLISRRVPRIYRQNGKDTEVVDYIKKGR